MQLWQGRWQGDEIIVKVLQVRDWTTRKSRDFNEEHPKLRYFSQKSYPGTFLRLYILSNLLTDSVGALRTQDIMFEFSF